MTPAPITICPPRLSLPVAAVILTLSFASGTFAQSLRYRPKADHEYKYGIELRILSKRPNSTLQTLRSQVNYQVNESNDSIWSADFVSSPVGSSGPYPGVARIEQIIRTNETMLSRLSERKMPVPPSPIGNQIRERRDAMVKQRYEDALARIKLYPGSFDFVQGQLRMSARGELLEQSHGTDLPLLAGPSVLLPFVRLPESGSEANFSYRSSTSDRPTPAARTKSPRASFLNALERVSSDSSNRFSYERKVELAGGDGVEPGSLMSGEGTWEFDPTESMPFAGSLQFAVDKIEYLSLGKEFDFRVGFIRLDQAPWRADFFYAGLLPTEQGLDAQNLPRLSAAEQRGLAKLIESMNTYPDSNVYRLMKAAPPPAGSALDRAVEALATADSGGQPDSSRRASSERRYSSSWTTLAVASQRRWNTIRSLASKLPRTWSDTSGSFRVKAFMIGREGDKVRLKRVDNGREIVVPLGRLSDVDQEFTRTFAVPE